MPRRTLSPGSRSGVPTAIQIGGLIVLSWAMVACAVDEPTALGSNPAVSLAKAPPPSVTVTSTDPTYAFQGDSMLSVRGRAARIQIGVP